MSELIPVFSASQVSTYLECQRKWGWKYIAKIDAPTHPSAALGSSVHHQLEALVRDGRPLDFTSQAGYIADAARPVIQDALDAPGWEVEEDFTLDPGHGAWTYRGFIDLAHYNREVPLVRDYKTTSNLKWAKTPGALETDVQAVIYAVQAFVRTGATAVDLEWIYLPTKGAHPKAHPVRVRITPEKAAQAFFEIECVASEMRDYADSVSKEEIPAKLQANPHSCESYGGCPYRHLCNLSPRERMTSIMTQGTTSSLLDRLKARAAGVEAAPVAAAPEPAPVEALLPAWATAPVDPLHVPQPRAAIPPPPPVDAVDAVDAVEVLAAGPGQINPPEFQPAPTVEERDAPKVAPPPEAPARRTRRTKAEMEAARAAENAPVVAAPLTVPAPPPESPAVEAPAVEVSDLSSKKIGMLLLGCVPTNGWGMSFEFLVASAAAKVCEAKNVGDWRYVEYIADGMLSEAMARILDAAPRIDALIVQDPSTREARACLSVLVERSSLMIRGV